MKHDLFNEKTIKRLCSDIEATQKQKNATKKWIELLENDELQEEVTNYPKFMIYILQELLGYDITTFKHEEKNMEFPFRDESGNFLVCFEAKGTKTKDLWSSQGRALKIRETPVNQINDYIYKNKIPYGVLTNYRIFVLFKRGEGYTKFHKFDFLDIKNKPEKLKEFIIVFSRLSFEEDKTESIYKESIVEERNFTKEFYKLYHETRLMILGEFSERNIEKKLSLHYTQLFLNRLMFIFFAEDTGLLERRYFETKILEVLKSSGIIDNYTNYIFGKIKSIFRELDKEIPKQIKGFNGELFRGEIDRRLSFKDYRNSSFFKDVFQNYKLDKKLELNKEDNKIFSNHKNKLSRIIYNILLMASFDFNTEVNVNILGHIFEQSISDLEELKGEKVLRRKKEGVYYTPDYITDYICRNTIIPYLSKNGVNSVDKLIDEYANDIEELEEKFKSLKILDPACGSGSFLIKAVEVLLEIHKQIQIVKEMEGQYTARKVAGLSRKQKRALRDNLQLTFSKWHEEEEAREIIENNIFGVDINEESVEITKLSMFLKIATKNKKLIDLSKNIKCGNSLIEDPTVDAKAFNWAREFPYKFDIIIGNPPYVKARENVGEGSYRDYLSRCNKFETLYEMWDLYVPFVERAIKLLKENGNFGFIIPDTLEKAKYASKLRNWLLNYFFVYQIDFFPDIYIFENVGVRNVILFVKKTKSVTTKNIHRFIHKQSLENIHKLPQLKKYDLSVFNSNPYELEILEGNKEYIFLGELCYVSYGLRLNSDERKAKGEFKKKDLLSDSYSSIHNRKFTEGKYISRYSIDHYRYVEWNTERCPTKLVRPTFKELYDPAKLLLGNINRVGAYDESKLIVDNTLIVAIPFHLLQNIENSHIRKYLNNVKIERKILEEESRKFSLKYILAIVNSKLMQYYLTVVIRKRELHAYPDDWKKIPIVRIPLSKQSIFVEKTDRMIDLNSLFNSKKLKFINRIRGRFGIDKITKKLQNLQELSFDGFKKEVKNSAKLRFHTSLEEKHFDDYWFDDFEETKSELLRLTEKIKNADKEINDLVYNLYGFDRKKNEKEINIVEGSLKN